MAADKTRKRKSRNGPLTVAVGLALAVGVWVLLPEASKPARPPSGPAGRTLSSSESHPGSGLPSQPADGLSGSPHEKSRVFAPASLTKRSRSGISAVEIRVTDKDTGSPISQAMVRIDRRKDRWDGKTTPVETLLTDATGRISTTLPPALYTVRVSADGYRGAHEIIGLSGAGAQREYALPPGGAVKGRVLASDGSPLERARVTLEGQDGIAAMEFSDSQGRFSTSVPFDRYRVTAVWRTSEKVIEDLSVSAGMRLLTIVMDTEDDLYHVRGRVVSDSGVPVAGALIWVRDELAGHRTRIPVFSIRSGADGSFELPLPQGRQFVARFSSPGFTPARLPCTGVDADGVEVVLRELQEFKVRVLSAEGSDLTDGVRLSASSLGDPPARVLQTVDRAAGLYASAEYPFQLFAEAVLSGEGRSRALIIRQYEPEIELRLRRGAGSIGVRVADADSNPVTQFLLFVNWVGGSGSTEVISEDGTFTIPRLPADEYTVQVDTLQGGSPRHRVRVGEGPEFVEIVVPRPAGGGAAP